MEDKYNFQVGEEVIDTYGRKGMIKHVCHCAQCRDRGFYEPMVKWEHNGDFDSYITCYQKIHGFQGIHRVGDRIFNPIDLEGNLEEQELCKRKIEDLSEQLRLLEEGAKLYQKEKI